MRKLHGNMHISDWRKHVSVKEDPKTPETPGWRSGQSLSRPIYPFELECEKCCLKRTQWVLPVCFQEIKGFLCSSARSREKAGINGPASLTIQLIITVQLSGGILAHSHGLNWIRYTRLFGHCVLAWESYSHFPDKSQENMATHVKRSGRFLPSGIKRYFNILQFSCRHESYSSGTPSPCSPLTL